MKLKEALTSAINTHMSVWAKVDPDAAAFTWDSEAVTTAANDDEVEGYIFFCDGVYLTRFLEEYSYLDRDDALDMLLDEVNAVEFPR